MRRRTLWAVWAGVVLGVVVALGGPGGTAHAHPLGNFTVGRYDGLVAGPGRLTVDHVEDLAEIPAAQAAPRIRAAGRAAWARQRCRDAADDARVTVAGRAAELTLGAARARVRPGQAGLDTLRVECTLTAALPREDGVSVEFRSGARDGTGWREITARGDRATLTRSDVPETSASERLTRYPKRLLSAPPDTASASLRITPGGPALSDSRPEERGSGVASVLPRGADRWARALTGLVGRHPLTPAFAALALGTAVLLGALHALAPGHGKTLMAATAAARGRASVRDVLPLAASVTVTHTLGVLALGLLVSGGSAAGPSVVAWLGVVSGLLVTGAGVLLVRRAWLRRRRTGRHEHTHDHGHTHHHDHGHHHSPGTGLRGMLFLGFAGGLVPSPSAVVVLVGAAALGEAWFGLSLVLAYGVGLAVTLTAAGFLVVRVGAFAGRRVGPEWVRRGTRRFLPLGSACVVLALGCGLVFKGAATALG
ncbi:nickel transporter [Streptomyces sp. Je 1-369]|uniref:HoxN/HupN/NixA family nickel/cobalt transporter n=1 Tax=Streptomyces sp. Je 1-369 TaxID=2966192 RepID=UPI0022866B10|nr:nickel transporter [Streptomyces sp. Je 1-369]WAL94607.1 nickel transporter [Streptomyces sp. Je 1-369]